MYAGLGDVWGDLVNALGPIATSASKVIARIQGAQRSGQSLTVEQAVAQAVAAGEIDPAAARAISNVAGTVARAAAGVQQGVGQAGILSQVSQRLQALPRWVVPAGLAVLAVMVLRRR
jgi:hypothetical protein